MKYRTWLITFTDSIGRPLHYHDCSWGMGNSTQVKSITSSQFGIEIDLPPTSNVQTTWFIPWHRIHEMTWQERTTTS